MEYWSVGALRQFGIAPRVRGVGSAFWAQNSIEVSNGWTVLNSNVKALLRSVQRLEGSRSAIRQSKLTAGGSRE